MVNIKFVAPEYQADGSFKEFEFEFIGDEKNGWEIVRSGQTFLTLPSGYTPVESLYCGVCSTDLARKFLPYPLPQIIGHEVVGKKDGQTVVVEINASQRARGIVSPTNPYTNRELHSHDPQRLTLGINQLSGGFAPVFLAPIDAIIPLPKEIDPQLACLIEPLAAANQALAATEIRQGQKIAVLGPRRLGTLIIAALVAQRDRLNIDFEICALARHSHLLEICLDLGADRAIDLCLTPATELHKQFDLVFDTTGNPQGLEIALKLAQKAVHLKSTHGRSALGLERITDLVVDEIALLPATLANLQFTWFDESSARDNRHIYVAEDVDLQLFNLFKSRSNHNFYRLSIEDAIARIKNSDRGYFPFARFDLAIAGSLAAVDRILRPIPGIEFSLVRPRGAILLTRSAAEESLLARAISQNNLGIYSSRCGDFRQAIAILQQNPAMRSVLSNKLITHCYPLQDIRSAFAIAANSSQSIKVIVQTS